MTSGSDSATARLQHYRAMFDLTGKTAIVLGAASGIGKASAEALAALGAEVVCADRDRDGVERAAAGLGLSLQSHAHVVDAGNSADIERLARPPSRAAGGSISR
jgi:NAD(P)-dependent dehydrogenase (short-subunit alcohol dehydrogenase family)